MKKFLKWFLVLLVILGIGIGYAWFKLNGIIQYGITEYGPECLGTNVTFEEVDFSPLAGVYKVKGLVIDNPEGFKQKTCVEIEEMTIYMGVSNLWSSKTVIDEIIIHKPFITYEVRKKQSNFDVIEYNIYKYMGYTDEEIAAEAEAAENAEEEEEESTYLIKSLTVTKAKFKYKKGLFELPRLPIPTFTMKNIGEDPEDKGNVSKGLLRVLKDMRKDISKSVAKAEKKQAKLDKKEEKRRRKEERRERKEI